MKSEQNTQPCPSNFFVISSLGPAVADCSEAGASTSVLVDSGVGIISTSMGVSQLELEEGVVVLVGVIAEVIAEVIGAVFIRETALVNDLFKMLQKRKMYLAYIYIFVMSWENQSHVAKH